MKIQKPLLGLVCSALFGCTTLPPSYPPPPFSFEQTQQYQPSIFFSEENAKFFAGFAKRTITPQKTSWLAGKAPRLGTKTQGDLWVRCLVLRDQDKNSVALVSLDLLGLMPSDVRDVQKRARAFFKGKILIHSTHTHSAPDTMGLWGPRLFLLIPVWSGRDESYMRALKENIVDCVVDAGERQKPAVVAFAETTLENVARGPRDMKNDESFFIVQIVTAKERMLLLNFAVHPETVKQDYVTADFLYYVYEYLGKASGGEIIYVNGAVGGVQPKGMPGRENDWPNAQNLATAMIQKALLVMPNSKISKGNRISWLSKTVWIRPENTVWKLATFLGLLPSELNEIGLVPVELNYLRIGDAGIITFPGEVFPNIAIRLKSEMTDMYKLTFGLTNGELGYFLFSDDVRSRKYKYHSRVSLGPYTGDIIFNSLETLIRSDKY